MRAGMRVLAGGLLLVASSLAGAQVFKCVDAGGQISYSQTPCVAESRELGRWQGSVGAVMVPAAAAVTMRPADVARAESRALVPRMP